jgi:hypothetical protein
MGTAAAGCAQLALEGAPLGAIGGVLQLGAQARLLGGAALLLGRVRRE